MFGPGCRAHHRAWNSQSFVFKMSSFKGFLGREIRVYRALCVRPGTVHHTCVFASGPRPPLLLLERIGCMQEVHHGPTVEVRRDSANPRPSPLISTPSILHKPHTLDPKPEALNPTLWHRPAAVSVGSLAACCDTPKDSRRHSRVLAATGFDELLPASPRMHCSAGPWS